ncbi:MAG: 6-hydroxycyclohex-1-ene-1-carbonyl-CoA dehydrogenase [Myxococcales bacterium]|nr:6-hydroxycyclohex-1-ene-1-carbonyl-CoA dehydrogenase [Myxococcales bacterium]
MSESPREIIAWRMQGPEQPLVQQQLKAPGLGAGQVLLEVAGCGLCHTDLSFLYGGVKTKQAPPLTLGHEISGTVVAAGDGASSWIGKQVVVPAVLPCGECELCRGGNGTACRGQIMPGNDIDGGFASHVVLPARHLCEVSDLGDFELWELGIIADAVTTPYQAMERARVSEGDVVVVIGVGGIGSYGVQIAAARGAQVIAVDVDAQKLARIADYGAAATVDASGLDERGVREAVRAAAKKLSLPRHRWRVFEMSGTAAGQQAAYSLLTFAGTVAFVGFTMDKVSVRLGNLMAFDATIFGNWGCLPELYPAALELVLQKKIAVRDFSKRYPLAEINDVIAAARRHELTARPVLTP